jgi:hypothetical protein
MPVRRNDRNLGGITGVPELSFTVRNGEQPAA